MPLPNSSAPLPQPRQNDRAVPGNSGAPLNARPFAKRWDPEKHPRDLIGRFRAILDEIAPGSGARIGTHPQLHAWRSPEGDRSHYFITRNGKPLHGGLLPLDRAAELALAHSGVRKAAGEVHILVTPDDLEEPVGKGAFGIIKGSR